MNSGIFDQLAELSKTSPSKKSSVGSLDASKTAETPETTQVPAHITRGPAKHTTDPHSHGSDKPSVRSVVKTASRTAARTSERSQPRIDVRAYGRSNRRMVVRYAFEFYQDQVEILRQISLQTKLAGDDVSMSEMVREALDEYITRKNLRTDERTG